MKILSSGHTDAGRLRDRNEDCFLIDQGTQLYLVCDGMGGHPAGDMAAATAARLVGHHVREHQLDVIGDPNRLTTSELMRATELSVSAITLANDELRDLSQSHPDFHGLGTTLTMLLIVGHYGVVGHVGDSCLYHCRGDQLRKLTSDHNLAAELQKTGFCSIDQLKHSHTRHLLTRSLGHDSEVSVDVFAFPIDEDDCLLLCTDGLSNWLASPEQLRPFFSGTPADIARRLVEVAVERDGTDNATAVVIRCDPSAPRAGGSLGYRSAALRGSDSSAEEKMVADT